MIDGGQELTINLPSTILMSNGFLATPVLLTGLGVADPYYFKKTAGDLRCSCNYYTCYC